MTTDTDRENWPDGMNIVNGHLAESIREQGMIQPPNTFGYIHLAAEVERPHPLRPNSAHKKALLASLRNAADDLVKTFPDLVRRADLFDAFVIPPGSAEGRAVIEKSGYDVHVAAFDVVLLLECANPDAAQAVRGSPEFGAIAEMLGDAATHTHCVAARNAKRIAEVDRDRDGIFLFNYFHAADIDAKGAKGVEILLAVWEYTAGWWTKKANLDNSTPLQPLDGEASDYSLVNHCRWDRLIDILPHLIFRPTLKKFVLANFTANDIVAMPVLYRLAKVRR
ncbi:MAG: hypothetical protein ACFE0S_12580 [Rhodospirillales bacterium]